MSRPNSCQASFVHLRVYMMPSFPYFCLLYVHCLSPTLRAWLRHGPLYHRPPQLPWPETSGQGGVFSDSKEPATSTEALRCPPRADLSQTIRPAGLFELCIRLREHMVHRGLQETGIQPLQCQPPSQVKSICPSPGSETRRGGWGRMSPPGPSPPSFKVPWEDNGRVVCCQPHPASGQEAAQPWGTP